MRHTKDHYKPVPASQTAEEPKDEAGADPGPFMCWACEPPQDFGQRQAWLSHVQEHCRPVPASQQANDYVGPSSRTEAMGLNVDSCNEEVPASDSLAEEDDWYSCYEVPVAEEAESREQLPPLPLPEPLAPLPINPIEEPDGNLISGLASQRFIKRFEFFLANICYKLMLQVFCQYVFGSKGWGRKVACPETEGGQHSDRKEEAGKEGTGRGGCNWGEQPKPN